MFIADMPFDLIFFKWSVFSTARSINIALLTERKLDHFS